MRFSDGQEKLTFFDISEVCSFLVISLTVAAVFSKHPYYIVSLMNAVLPSKLKGGKK
jgi:hypothetical protein